MYHMNSGNPVYITGIGQVEGTTLKKELTAGKVLGYPYKPFGRMDYFSRLGFTAVFYALKDAGMEKWHTKRDIGIIASTVYGSIETDMHYFETVMPHNGVRTSPALFAYTLPGTFMGEACIALGLTGDCFVINEECSKGITALKTAMHTLLSSDGTHAMVCGVCDSPAPAALAAGPDFYSGARFMVLEKKCGDKGACHGKLFFNENHEILYKEQILTDIAEIISNRQTG